MAEHGEWNRKGATLSDATALKDYGVNRDFIVQGIQAGKLEYREGAIWGNPYIKVLKSQLERFITEQLGPSYLANRTAQTELRKVNKEIAELKKKIKDLQTRKEEIEKSGAL
jgi:coenzyme F420-reducing hydrogenase delta subunit